jgi:dihydrofolate reductase
MRKLIVLSFVTLDGVMQAPGLPEEDPSGGFKFGGWTVPYFDESLDDVMSEQMGHPFDLLLGRKTYDIFAAFWPQRTSQTAAALNKATKYVASHKPLKSDWKTTVHLGGDVAGEIRKLKSGTGPELQVHGSGNLIQTLLKNDLVDELWLKTFPVLLGTGKKLFADGVVPAGFRVEKTSVSPSGVVVAIYERAGEVKTGSF